MLEWVFLAGLAGLTGWMLVSTIWSSASHTVLEAERALVYVAVALALVAAAAVLVPCRWTGGARHSWLRGLQRAAARDPSRPAEAAHQPLGKRETGVLARRLGRNTRAIRGSAASENLRALLGSLPLDPDGVRDAHDLYLEVLAELGPVGLALFLAGLAPALAGYSAAVVGLIGNGVQGNGPAQPGRFRLAG